MSLETVALISLLTLLSLCLGSDIFWLSVINPALSQVSNQSRLETLRVLQEQVLKFFPIVYLLVFVCAVVLNVISHSRSEPYLLKIGLISLVLYFSLILVSFLLCDTQTISLAAKPDLSLASRAWKSNRVLWLLVPTIFVSFWSFLHYAMNPKL